MESIKLEFCLLYPTIILDLFDTKKSLLNKCINTILNYDIKYDKIPSELNEIIKIYKCCQRIKLTLKKRSDSWRQTAKIRYKYKFHIMFLTHEIQYLIGSKIESNTEQLINKIIEIITQCNIKVEDIKKTDVDEITITNFQNNAQVITDKLNVILSKEDLPYKKVSHSYYSGFCHIDLNSNIISCYR